MSLPNTFIIGIQKAGTTAFYDWISQHPDVYGPEEVKDLHFFSLDQYFNQGKSFLEKVYKGHKKEKIIINAGVNYINHPFALERIKKYNPNAKIILIFRDPVKRAFSAYNYFFKLGYENETFENALKREQSIAFTDMIEQANLTYLGHGLYYDKLKSLTDIFPREQIKVLVYEEVVKQKEKFIEETFEFLGVEPTFKCEFRTLNRTGKPAFRWINKLFLSNSQLKSRIKSWLPYDKMLSLETRNKIAQKIISLNTKKQGSDKLSEKQYNELRAQFEKDINKLSEFIGKDLNQIWRF